MQKKKKKKGRGQIPFHGIVPPADFVRLPTDKEMISL